MTDVSGRDTLEPGQLASPRGGPGPPAAPARASRFEAAVRRMGASPGWRFGSAAVAAAGLFALVYAVFVLSRPGQRLENVALMGAQLRGTAVREESLAYLSQVTVLTFAVALIGIAAIAFVRRRPGLGVLITGVMGASTVLAEILKDVLPRPELMSGPAWILRNDFPSGTATAAAALGVGALLVAPDRLRWIVLPVGALFAAIIGQSTQITGWHRMSGAIGGVLLVMAAAAAALFVLGRFGLVQRTSVGRVHPRLRAAILVLPAAALIIAIAALSLLVAFPLLQVPRDADAVFLHTVFELLGFGFTILAFVGFATVIEPFSFGRSAARGRGMPSDVDGTSAADDRSGALRELG